MSYIPKQMMAGFTTTVKVPVGVYTPSAGYMVQLVLKGPAAIVVQGVIDEDQNEYAFKVTPATNGIYSAAITAESTTERVLIETTRVDVAIDPTSILVSTDLRSYSEKILDAIEARIENRISKDQESLTIAGRQIVHIPIEELMKLRTQFRKEVLARKGMKIKTIKYRFTGE